MTKHHGSLPAKRSGTFTPFFNEVRRGVYTDQTERFLLEDNGQLEYIITDLRLNKKVGRARGLSYARDRVKTYLQSRNERLEAPPSLPPNRPAITEGTRPEPPPFNPPRLVVTPVKVNEEPLIHEDHGVEAVEMVEFIADLNPVEELPPLPIILRDSVPGLLKVIDACKSDATFQVTAAEIAIITDEKLGVAVRRLDWLLKSGYLVVVENKKRGGCLYKWERPADELIERVSELRFSPLPHKREEDTPDKVIAAMAPQTQPQPIPPVDNIGDDVAVMVGRVFVKIAALEEEFGSEKVSVAEEVARLAAKVDRLQADVGRIAEWLQKVFQAPVGGNDNGR
jgi:hypothetical protein